MECAKFGWELVSISCSYFLVANYIPNAYRVNASLHIRYTVYSIQEGFRRGRTHKKRHIVYKTRYRNVVNNECHTCDTTIYAY